MYVEDDKVEAFIQKYFDVVMTILKIALMGYAIPYFICLLINLYLM